MRKMKKKVVIFIILLIFILPLTHVIAKLKETTFFEVNKTKIAQSDTLQMTLDISKIEKEKFEFRLISNIKAEEITTEEEITVDKEEVGTIIELKAQIVEDEEIIEERNIEVDIIEKEQNEEENQEENKSENKPNIENEETNKPNIKNEEQTNIQYTH